MHELFMTAHCCAISTRIVLFFFDITLKFEAPVGLIKLFILYRWLRVKTTNTFWRQRSLHHLDKVSHNFILTSIHPRNVFLQVIQWKLWRKHKTFSFYFNTFLTYFKNMHISHNIEEADGILPLLLTCNRQKLRFIYRTALLLIRQTRNNTQTRLELSGYSHVLRTSSFSFAEILLIPLNTQKQGNERLDSTACSCEWIL